MPSPELTLLLHQALEPRLTRLLELDRLPEWEQNPELLHQVRVASRRVRAVLDLVDPSIYPGFHRHERRLRKLTKALGATRELDVFLIILQTQKAGDSDPARGALVEHVQELVDRRRRKIGRPLLKELEGAAIGELSALLEKAILPPVVNECEQTKGAWQCLEPMARRLQDALPLLFEREDVEALHRFRIQLKRLRYTLEILDPAFPQSLEEWLLRLKAMQTALGEHHDLAMLEATLWKEQEGLAARGRTLLAAAALDLLAATAEERRGRYERFCALGRSFSQGMFYFNLRQMLETGGPR